MNKRLFNIPLNDRPREKLAIRGAAALTDTELMAILLGNGIKGHDVMKVAEKVVKSLDQYTNPDLHALQKIEGIGMAKAAVIAACLEFSRRRIRPEGIKISSPTDVLPIIRHYGDRKQEHFICISVNGANEVIKSRVVSIGLVNSTQVHPREVFADPILDRASSVIIAHNHPSGNLTPTPEDLNVTRRLISSANTLGIQVLDHIIFDHKGFYSFAEKGIL
jgi:DNA repair protein RadC